MSALPWAAATLGLRPNPFAALLVVDACGYDRDGSAAPASCRVTHVLRAP